MKIDRVVLSEFRRFREPLELAGLQPGLNIFVGPNEAGKSTIAAAIRAAFLERSKTTKVADLASWGMSNARPTVEIDFQSDGVAYRLRKSFLQRPRCELSIGSDKRLEGEAAEDRLAQLLGFEFPAKGQSRPEHAGLPGLLWIQQGTSQALHESAAHAAQHLREALTRLSGQLTTTDGDRLHDRVAADRGELLDARGKPRGRLREAADSLARAIEEKDRLTAAVQALDADVDRLARLRGEHDLAVENQAWIDFDRQAALAQERVAHAGKAREHVETLRRDLARCEGSLTLLRDHVRRDQHDTDALAASTGQAEAAGAHAEALAQSLHRARDAMQACEHADARARRQAMRANNAAERRDLDDDIARRAGELAQLQARRIQAVQLSERADAMQADLAAKAVDPGDLATLRKLEQDLHLKHARLAAVAPRVRYVLDDGAAIRIAGRSVSGTGEITVTDTISLSVDGVGTIQILPGEGDLALLAGQVHELTLSRDRLLRAMAAASLQEAEAQAALADRLKRDLESAQGAVRVQAPDGIPALAQAISDLQSRLQQARVRRTTMDGETDGGVAASDDNEGDDNESDHNESADARRGDDRGGQSGHDPIGGRPGDDAACDRLAGIDIVLARDQAIRAAAALDRAREELAGLTSRYDSARAAAELLRQQVQAARGLLGSAESLAARSDRAGQLIELRGESETLARDLNAAQAELQAHRPELAEQDARRFAQSAAHARREHEERRAQLLQLQGRLEQAGALGLGESLLSAGAALDRCKRAHDELERRARALDLLFRLLTESREQATQRLQAPLSRKLNHYLGLIFPNSSVQLDEALMPVSLARGGDHDPMRQLSFGTQEQLGVLVRLAYADLLREADRPTLIILDDALVHSDRERRLLMKRALFDAAGRHQILMFTCHGESWRDLGAPLRNLA